MGQTNFKAIGLKPRGLPVELLFNRVINAAATFDPPSLTDGSGAVSSGIKVEGAKLGDFILVSAPYDLQGIIAQGFVSNDNEVKISLYNKTGSTVDLGKGEWKIKVLRG